jgi:hypothetical protein
MCFIAFAYEFARFGRVQQANLKIQEMNGTHQFLVGADGTELLVRRTNTVKKHRESRGASDGINFQVNAKRSRT